jgi:glycosyltransferase involved in cell wall biosynthesis
MICRSPHGAARHVLTVIRWPVGGIRTYLRYNYPRLIEAGYRFTLVGPDDDAFARLRDDWQGCADVEFVAAPMRGQQCELRPTVRRLLRQQRHALVHSQGLTAAVDVILASFGLQVPHIITSHDVFRPGQFRGLRGQGKLLALRWLLRQADALVTVGADAAQNHRAYLGRIERGGCRMLTIANGIETARFGISRRDADHTLRVRLGIPRDAFLLGFLGRFMEQKGFLVLADALEQALAAGDADRLHLLAAGSGDYLREYKSAVLCSPLLAGRVTFVEHTTDISPLLGEIDLLVVPSLWEACPLLPMEAMCAGVPVLGSDCIGLREVLSGSPSMVVRSGDAEALGIAIRQAQQVPWRSRAMEYASVARQRFDVRERAEELRCLFDEFVT